MGLALALLLTCSSLCFLLLGAAKIATVAGLALVSGGAGFLKCDGNGLAAFAVTAALEFAVLELMMTRPVIRFCRGVSLAIEFLPVSVPHKKRAVAAQVPVLGNVSLVPKLVWRSKETVMALITKTRIHRFGGKEVPSGRRCRAVAPGRRRRNPSGGGRFRDRLKHLRMFFTFRALIIGARGRIGTHDKEIGARGETVMARAGG